MSNTTRACIAAAAVCALFASGCNMAINRSVHVDDGEKVGHGYNAINGNVTIGNDCSVKGDCRSVNGSIRIGTNTHTGALQSVNGSIRIGSESVIHGSIASVNGPVDCGDGVVVQRDLDTVNGDVELVNTRVERDLTTYNGDVTLRRGSVVEGDIVIKEPKGSSNHKEITIRLADASVVKGDVINRSRDVTVNLILSGNSEVKGNTRRVEVSTR
ncbi:hypothetical protein JXO52_12640 [bacterium]|nr:hypothetical protein [bacterium]